MATDIEFDLEICRGCHLQHGHEWNQIAEFLWRHGYSCMVHKRAVARQPVMPDDRLARPPECCPYLAEIIVKQQASGRG